MGNVHIGDDVLCNILARLPGKPLLRLRCASKHWNHLISDPYFMKSRSRRMILLPYTRPLVVIDDNVPAEDEAHSMVRIPSPLKHEEGTHVSVVGTLNGIVILALHDTSLRCHLILYNPLTSASKIFEVMDPPLSGYPYVFGFDTDDLKIVRFNFFDHWFYRNWYVVDAFDLKTSSWSSQPECIKRNLDLVGDPGLFLNGFLYWPAHSHPFLLRAIAQLNVKKLVLSPVSLPYACQSCVGQILGSIDGCLCVVNNLPDTINTFNVWMMKEEGKWLKAFSFSFGSEGDRFHPICILGDEKGKIVIKSYHEDQLVIYDASKDSYKMLKRLAVDDYMPLNWYRGFNYLERYGDYPFRYSSPIRYVESLLSPSDIC